MTSSIKHSDSRSGGSGESMTPGRPKDSGSRQQTHAGQISQTGSPSADREHTEHSGKSTATKPLGAK